MSPRRSVFDVSAGGARREHYLNAAAELFAERGYHAVGIDDIGEATGVTGPAIYRHFSSKSALLVGLFNKLTDELVARATEIVGSTSTPEEALRSLIRYQTEMCVYDRAVISVYLTEFRSLPADDQRTLRIKQRPYLFEWMRTLGKIHPAYSEGQLRALVHASIGVSQSVVYYNSQMDDTELIDVVAKAAEATLAIPPAEVAVMTGASSQARHDARAV